MSFAVRHTSHTMHRHLHPAYSKGSKMFKYPSVHAKSLTAVFTIEIPTKIGHLSARNLKSMQFFSERAMKSETCLNTVTNPTLATGCFKTVKTRERRAKNCCKPVGHQYTNQSETATSASKMASHKCRNAVSSTMRDPSNSGTAISSTFPALNSETAVPASISGFHDNGALISNRITTSTCCGNTVLSVLNYSGSFKTTVTDTSLNRNNSFISSTKSHHSEIPPLYRGPRSKEMRTIFATACRHAPSRGIHTMSPDIPGVTLLDMKRALKQKGLALEDGYTALAVKCLLCEEPGEPGEQGTMYINKTTGYFLCPKCHAHGEWWLLARVLARGAADERARDSLSALRTRRRDFERAWRQLQRATRPLAALPEPETRRLCELHDYPYYPECTKALAEVRCDETCTTLYFPLKNSLDTVVGYRKVAADKVDRPENVGHHTAGLFSCRASRTSKSDQAVLVPTVADLLCLHKEKVPGSLVWWCEGALPPPMLPVLEGFARVCVWGGTGGVRGLADKLRPERARFVRPVDGAGSAREAAAGGRPLRTLVADAAPAAHRAITTFAALRDEVYANLVNADQVRGVKWSRFPALTRLLGGHRRGELTVLTGPTGCGKTTLTAEMSLDLAAKGVSTLWGSFEIRNTRLAQTMLQQFAGVPLQEHLDRFPSLAADFERLPIYFLAFHGPQPIGTVMEAVEHARYVHDIEHVIVDNVQFMLGLGGAGRDGAGGGGGERYFRQDEVVAAFRALATRRDCHVTLVMHPRKEREADDLSTSSIFGSAKASQEADNVLIIQDKRLTAVRGKKFLQVAKNRFSGDLGIVPLEFDKSALSYQVRKRPAKDKEEKGADADRQGQDGKDKPDHRQDGVDHRQDGGERDLKGHSEDKGKRRQSNVERDKGEEHRNRKQDNVGEHKNRKTGLENTGDSFLRDVLDIDKGT